MRARFLAILLATLPTLAPSVGAWSWAVPASIVRESTVAITDVTTQTIVCTAFSINRAAGYFLTAEHCLPDGDDTIVIAGASPAVLWASEGLDLAVISCLPASRRGVLRRGGTYPPAGEEVAALGHAEGWPEPSLMTGRVSARVSAIPAHATGGQRTFLVMDFPVIGGMSGGPVFDRDGRVVGVLQISNNARAAAAPIDVAFAATAAYWD